MRVAALVVNWNGADHLAACLDSLLAQDHRDLDVFVVDNASTDASHEVLAGYLDRVRVLWNPTNRGFAGGVNDGLAAADEVDAVLTVNPDVVARPDYVRRTVEVLRSRERCGAVQGKLLRTAPAPSGDAVIDTTGHVAFRTRLFRNRGEGEVDREQYDAPSEVFGVSGALALYRRAMLDDVAIDVAGRHEVFDEDLFAFWEDVDLDWRARMHGWEAWYEPAAVAVHERGGAGPRRTRRVEQLNWQNRLLVLWKNDTWPALLPALPGFLLTLLLKTGELLLTVPLAFVAALPDVRLVRRMLVKRAQVHAAPHPSHEIVRRWFGAFDYRAWARTWWRRVRGVPPGG
ncbi:MAG: glycosyltransferase family 2 protein [Actinobacteria bacterium]|nr:glycosyltransferase family 2 protein [Actinomycetota bacterium]